MLACVLIFLLSAAVPAQTARQADSLYRVDIYEHYLAGDKEAVLQTHRDLIDYHRKSGDERLFYNAYASLFERLQEYGRSPEIVDLLEEMTREAVGSRRGKAVTEFCFGQYYLGARNPQEAEGHYRLAMRELSALEEWPRAIRAGFNLQAVAMNLNRLDEGLAMNDTTARYRLDLAGFQQDNEDYEQAVMNYRLYAAESDSAQVQYANEQINALSKQFQLQELKLENKVARQRLAGATIVIILLLGMIVIVLIYVWILRRKNRTLYEAARENMRQEDEAAAAREKIPMADRTREERIYAELVARMQQDELFRKPDLGRDELAKLVGTNRTFLAQAVSEFITHFRLRYAAGLLSDNPGLSVLEIGEMAGFSSRNTMHRQFSDHFGMSPLEYRRASRAKA